MDSIFKEILRQTSKVIKILTRLEDQYPKLTAELDLALYAAIKMEKIV